MKNTLFVLFAVIVFVFLQFFFWSSDPIHNNAYKMGGLMARSLLFLVLIYPIWERTPWRSMSFVWKFFLCCALIFFLLGNYNSIRKSITYRQISAFNKEVLNIVTTPLSPEDNPKTYSVYKDGDLAPFLNIIREYVIFSMQETIKFNEAFEEVDLENLLEPKHLCDAEHLRISQAALKILKQKINESEIRRDQFFENMDAKVVLFTEQLNDRDKMEFFEGFNRGLKDGAELKTLKEYYNIQREIITEMHNLINFMASIYRSYTYEDDEWYFEYDEDMDIYEAYMSSIFELGIKGTEIIEKIEMQQKLKMNQLTY